jgi:hypothetical protein
MAHLAGPTKEFLKRGECVVGAHSFQRVSGYGLLDVAQGK